MKKLTRLPLLLGCVLAGSNSHAIDLKQSKVTQVVNDVEIISAADQKEKAATVNDIFSMPDILRTGPSSRAELIAADETVTRVGANTIFSFDPATRTIDLKQGSLLFHSPHGKGGGTIHTGSATASVLGTTLIVTTTPSGGLKVLDLEGSVEVKFLNGLKQYLAPGHMTFVLPGGNQLAPIIIFRLDDLTKHSQLVKGFNGQLASLALIEKQIDKQIKAIHDGKLKDTGKWVGNKATPTTVETIMIDPNSLPPVVEPNHFKSGNSPQENSPQENAALAADATINQSSLAYAGIPVPPARIFFNPADPSFSLPGNTYYAGQVFVGFAAKNIYFNTVQAERLAVDLSQYANVSEFDFAAAGNITFGGSVSFDGLSLNESIIFSLIAGNQINVAAGSTIRGNVANFDWQSPATITLDNVQVFNNVGNTVFSTGAGFVMQNGAYVSTAANLTALTMGNISLDQATLGADSIIMNSSGGTLTLNASPVTLNSFAVFTGDQGVTLSGGTTISADGVNGHVALNSAHGSVNVSDTSISTGFLSVNSGDGILLDGAGQSFTIGNLSLTAANQATIQNADLSSVAYLNVAAHTITVKDTIFNASYAYNFGTATGQVNVNNGTAMGQLNLISDSIGNTAITSASQIDTAATGPSTAAGIHSYSLHSAVVPVVSNHQVAPAVMAFNHR